MNRNNHIRSKSAFPQYGSYLVIDRYLQLNILSNELRLLSLFIEIIESIATT